MTNPIQPIETRYAGCRFRSRTEARFAVLFEALGIRWEYEPQGYQLPSGPYLPDFKLHGLGGDGEGKPYLWFEVKPNDDQPEDPRWAEMSDDAPLIVAFGIPPANGDLMNDCPRQHGWMEAYDRGGWDSDRMFATCLQCGRLGITFSGLGSRVCSRKAHGELADEYTFDNPRILAAYTDARSARFEHGEQG